MTLDQDFSIFQDQTCVNYFFNVAITMGSKEIQCKYKYFIFKCNFLVLGDILASTKQENKILRIVNS